LYSPVAKPCWFKQNHEQRDLGSKGPGIALPVYAPLEIT
jgi:hypothetical protein